LLERNNITVVRSGTRLGNHRYPFDALPFGCLYKMLLLFHRSCLSKLPELFGMRNRAFEFDAYFDGQQASVSFCNSGCHSPFLKIWILDKKLSQRQ